jgi:hypothetical protein
MGAVDMAPAIDEQCIAGEVMRVVAQLTSHTGARGGVEFGDHDLCTFGREAPGDTPADAIACTRDDCHPVV